MKATAKGQPQLPAVVPTALDCFQQWPSRDETGEWPFVGFGELLNYLRGSRKLRIPPEWRGIIPDRLD